MQGSAVPHYFTPRVGEYDMWAIKYGYMTVEGEAEELLVEHEASNLNAGRVCVCVCVTVEGLCVQQGKMSCV